VFEPTIKDIAKLCGVGVSTVSRAINDHPDINPETKEKIMDTIMEYGYIPNNSARNLKRSDAKAIAVLIKGIANPFFTSMIKVIEQECKRKHYAMELSHIEALVQRDRFLKISARMFIRVSAWTTAGKVPRLSII